jgi:hypothetical protein
MVMLQGGRQLSPPQEKTFVVTGLLRRNHPLWLESKAVCRATTTINEAAVILIIADIDRDEKGFGKFVMTVDTIDVAHLSRLVGCTFQ